MESLIDSANKKSNKGNSEEQRLNASARKAKIEKRNINYTIVKWCFFLIMVIALVLNVAPLHFVVEWMGVFVGWVGGGIARGELVSEDVSMAITNFSLYALFFALIGVGLYCNKQNK